MNIDQLILENEDEKFNAYILATVNYNNFYYIYYTKEIKEQYQEDDIYIGKLLENRVVIPVEENMIPYLEKKWKSIIYQIKK